MNPGTRFGNVLHLANKWYSTEQKECKVFGKAGYTNVHAPKENIKTAKITARTKRKESTLLLK